MPAKSKIGRIAKKGVIILRKIKKLSLAILTVILSLIVADFLLGVAAFVSPRVNEVLSVVPRHVPDKRLKHRPNPAYPDHDENGFRNPKVPETAQVVALGDSQTYGNGAKAEQAWPKVLEKLSGRTVYNMAFGGYGPVQSLMLWDQAVALKPEIIIEGLYSGNDLYDSYQMIHLSGNMPELMPDEESVMETISQAEKSAPVGQRLSKAGRSEKKISAFKKFRKSIKPWFTEHSNLYGLYWRAKYELSHIGEKDDEDRWQSAKASADKHPEKTQAFSSKLSRTVFKSAYRLTALNLDDPTIREGQRIILEVIRRMDQLASRDGIRFIVLLIPTKELVFSEQAKGITASSYQALVENERQFWKEVKLYLDEHSIEYMDSLQSLQAQLETNSQPYRVTGDGHPREHGYRAIAHAIHSYLALDPQQELK